MRKILILIGRYLPGYKDGGPIRSITNLTEALGEEYDFRIVCLDRDLGDSEPYSNIEKDQWNAVGKAKVWYVKPGGYTFSLIRKLAAEVDLIYSCGFYGDYGYKTLMLNRLGKLDGKPVIVAPMGTFSEGALSHKSLKKKLFICGCKWLGLFNAIKWSVTSELEKADVQKNIGWAAECVIAEDLPRTNIPGIAAGRNAGDALKVVFLSRICPQKNLLGAIQCLQQVHSQVEFTIYGPLEDVTYWETCKEQLDKLPGNVRWHYDGVVSAEEVQKKLQQHDVFLFPTKGENYGHVIFEALSVGCIPIISDQTMWGMIAERNAGYIIPLSDEMTAFAKTIDDMAAIEPQRMSKMSQNAVALAQEKVNNAVATTGYRYVFN